MDDMDIELSLPNEDEAGERQQFKWQHQIYCLQKQPGAASSLPMLAV